MKLSDFGLCKPLDCSILQEKDFSVGKNLSGALQSDGRPAAPKRTQQEQLQHWQRNRRMLVWFLSFHTYVLDILNWPSIEVLISSTFYFYQNCVTFAFCEAWWSWISFLYVIMARCGASLNIFIQHKTMKITVAGCKYKTFAILRWWVGMILLSSLRYL